MPTICHFTDIENLRGILKSGQIQCHADAPTSVEVGDAGIKASRKQRPVPCGPGGMVGDYVPFYFGPRSPMMYKISRGTVDGVCADLDRLVYLVSSTEIAWEAGLRCVYTDGNAAVVITRFHDDPAMLADYVDFPLMKERYWMSTPEDPDRMRRRMAEFLVHGSFSVEHVRGIVTMTPEARESVIEIADGVGLTIKSASRSGWYY